LPLALACMPPLALSPTESQIQPKLEQYNHR